MFVAVDRVAGGGGCCFFFYVFDLVGCGFEHVKSPVLPSVVIEFLQIITVLKFSLTSI